MANVGKLNIGRNENGDFLGRGHIRSREFKDSFRMVENRESRGDSSPTHLLFMKDSDDEYFQVGAAWAKEMERGDFVGMNMYSLSFDEPSLPDWMSNIAAFPETREGEYNIVYKRQRQAA